jgi:hypothetical protein
VGGPLLSILAPAPAPVSPPPAGEGGHNSAAAVGRSSRLTPGHPASPSTGVVGEPARQGGCQLTNPSPRPPTSLASPTWASVVRGGVATCVGVPASPKPPQSCTISAPCLRASSISRVEGGSTRLGDPAADFLALYYHCTANGFEARLKLNHHAAHHEFIILCRLPAPSTSTRTDRKRRRCRRHRRRHGPAASPSEDMQPPAPSPVQETQPSAVPSTLPEPTTSSTPPPLTIPSPDVAHPPAKRSRKRRCEHVAAETRRCQFATVPSPSQRLTPIATAAFA